MLPFITIGNFNIPLYSICILIGAILGFLLAVYLPYKKTIPKADIFYAGLYAMIGVIIGAKLLFVIISFPEIIKAFKIYGFNLQLINYLFRAGFVYYGGFIGGIVGLWFYSHTYKIPFLDLVETLIPSVPLVHTFGRLGCFFAGCCYGIPINPPWGLYFSPKSVAPPDIALFPVQLLEAFFNFIIFILLFLFSRKEKKPGQIAAFYLIAYGLIRFCLEFLRFDSARGLLFNISTSQYLSIIFILVGLYLFWQSKNYYKKNQEP